MIVCFPRWTATLVLLLATTSGAWSQDVQRSITESISRGVAEGVSRAARSAAVRPVLVVNRGAAEIVNLRLSTAGAALVITTKDGLVRSWSLHNGQFVAASRVTDPAGVVDSAVSDQLQAVLLRRGGGTETVDLATGQVLRSVRTSVVEAGAVSPDATTAVAIGRGASLVDLSRGSVSAFSAGVAAIAAAYNPEGRLVALASTDGSVRIVDTSGQVSGTFSSPSTPVEGIAWQGGGRVVSVMTRDGTLIWHDVGTNRPLRNARLPQGRPNAIAWDPATERVLAATGDGTLRLFDGATGTLLRAFTEEDNLADYLAIYPGGRFAFSASRTGQIKLWDLEAGLSRAQIIITQHGWAVMDSLGRFDGSDDGLADISWQAARLAVPIDRFERYREPGLLARILIDAISFDRPAVAPVQNGIVPPPTVTFTSAPRGGMADSMVRLTAHAEDRGGGLSSIVLFRNGRVVANTPAPAGRSIRALDADFELALLPGENSFRAVATDRFGVESEPAAALVSVPDSGGSRVLHVISIAIDRYRDRAIRPLSLSVGDAIAIEGLLTERGRTPFADVQVLRLHNENASQAAVISALAGLRDLPPRDAVVLFIAGHGVALGDDWLLLPYDAVLRGNSVDRAIGVSTLQDALAMSAAREILVLIDSCESGQVATRISLFLERGSLAGLGRKGGIALLAASRADEPAYENAQLGHGLLTATLLQGLRGAADPGHRDGRISAYGLIAYAEANVPLLARRYASDLQVPVAKAFGSNFFVRNY